MQIKRIAMYIILSLVLTSSRGIRIGDVEGAYVIENDANQNSKYSFVDREFVDMAHENSWIKIKYPEVQGVMENKDKVNEMIKESAIEYIDNSYGKDYSDLQAKIDYFITDASDSKLSIVFLGEGFVKTAAHPNNIIYSLNINIPSANKIKLNDIYRIDESFVDLYLENAKKQLSPQLFSSFEGLSNEEILNGLRQIDDENSGVYSFFTKDSVIISYPVAHVFGDHIEVAIPKSTLGPLEIDHNSISQEMVIKKQPIYLCAV